MLLSNQLTSKGNLEPCSAARGAKGGSSARLSTRIAR